MLDIKSKQIHEIAVAKAGKYLVAESELLSAIIEVDRHKLYEKFDEPYLTPYCVKYLNLSEDVAAVFVRVARKSQQVPELELAVQEGLQMSKAKTIASVIDQGNKDHWIEKAQTLTKEKLEREVAAANPSAAKPEKARATGHNRIRIEFEVTYEEAEVLKRARELMSQKKCKDAQIGETFMCALRVWVDREDPVRKAERARERKEKTDRQERNPPHEKDKRQDVNQRQDTQGQDNQRRDSAQTQERTQSHEGNILKTPRHRSRDRFAVPAEIVHQVNLRDRGACHNRMPDGSICGCRKWTDIHHIIPRAYGGVDALENLITLCRAHHRQIHERSVRAG